MAPDYMNVMGVTLMNDYQFGNYIFELRKRSGLSQSELAAKVGVTNKAVSKWEVGKAKPSVETIRKLAVLFRVSVDELLRKREEEKQTKKTEQAEQLRAALLR